MKRPLLTLLMLTLSACAAEPPAATETDSRTSIATQDGITAQIVASGIALTNKSSVEIAYVAKNPMWLGLLAGCNNAPCAKLAAGASVVIPNGDINGYDAAALKLEVWYWPAGSNDSNGKVIEVAKE